MARPPRVDKATATASTGIASACGAEPFPGACRRIAIMRRDDLPRTGRRADFAGGASVFALCTFA